MAGLFITIFGKVVSTVTVLFSLENVQSPSLLQVFANQSKLPSEKVLFHIISSVVPLSPIVEFIIIKLPD